MKRHIFKTSLISIAIMAALVFSPAIHAKKDKSEGDLKKIVAIGHVDTGYMGFSGMAPGQVGDLIKNKIKNKLEEKGYVVLTPETKTTKEEKVEDIPQPKTAAEAMKYAQQMQEMMQKMSLKSAGKYVHQPVAAEAVFNFTLTKGESGLDTGGLFSEAQYWTGAPVGGADFSAHSMKAEMQCIQLDPQDGHVVDQHRAKASTIKATRLGGASYYTMEDTSDPDRAFDRMFNRAANECVKWVDKKMSSLPWEAQIVGTRSGQFMINAGSNAGIKEGMSFSAFKRQGVSAGGVKLGTEEISKGVVQITQVQEGYSLAKPISGSVAKGDILKPVSDK